MSLARTLKSSAVVMILGAGMALGPGFIAVDLDHAKAQGKSEDRGNKGGNKGGSDSSESRGGGNKPSWAGAQGGGGKSSAPGQLKRQAEETTLAATTEDGLLLEEEVEEGKSKRGRGSIASQLGALNAAHASEQAFANASPNSRVGRIAAYRDAVLGADASDDRVDALAGLLEDLPEDATKEEILAAVETDLIDSGLFTEDELADFLDAAAEEGTTPEDLLAELEGVETGIEGEEITKEDALALLEAAANKPVTDEVVEEVNNLLGIEFPEEWTEEPDPAPTDELVVVEGEEGGETVIIVTE